MPLEINEIGIHMNVFDADNDASIAPAEQDKDLIEDNVGVNNDAADNMSIHKDALVDECVRRVLKHLNIQKAR